MEFIYEYYNNLLDFLFPKQCVNCEKFGNYLCTSCKINFIQFQTERICPYCKKETLLEKILVHNTCKAQTALDEVMVCVRYNSLVQEIIENIKYQYYFDVVKLVVDLMFENLDISKLQNSTLVSIPLHKAKYNSRGFNQAELIAKEIQYRLKKIGMQVEVVNLFERVKNTKTQVGMNREERKLNLKEAFKLRSKQLSRISRKIWLVDDVMTTGTTLEECAQLIKFYKYKVGALVFARG